MSAPEADRQELAERGKVMLGRSIQGQLWWRITAYVGDTREDLEKALDDALALDERLRGLDA